jgi:hypothetical protein
LKKVSIITLLYEFALWSVDISPGLVHFLTEELSKNFMKEVNLNLQTMLVDQDCLNP